jgi:uncharacterized protein
MLLCDTSVVYAAIDSRERDHAACRTLLRSVEGIAVPSPVIVEVDWIGRSRGRADAGDQLLRSIGDGSTLVVNLDESDLQRSRALLHAYHDLPLDFVDAAVVCVAERLGQATVATLNRKHFSVVRPLHCEAFTLLP